MPGSSEGYSVYIAMNLAEIVSSGESCINLYFFPVLLQLLRC